MLVLETNITVVHYQTNKDTCISICLLHLVWKLGNSKLGMMWYGQQEISALLLHWRKIPSPSLLSRPAPVQAGQHEVVSLLLLGQEEKTIPHLSQHFAPVGATLLVSSVNKYWSLIFKQTTGTAVDTRYLRGIRTLVRHGSSIPVHPTWTRAAWPPKPGQTVMFKTILL